GGRPALLHRGGQAGAKLADVPGPADVEGKESSREVLIQVRDLGFGARRSKAAAEESEVERERDAKSVALEIAVAIAVAQQRGAALQGENHRRLPLTDGKQDRIVVASDLRFD